MWPPASLAGPVAVERGAQCATVYVSSYGALKKEGVFGNNTPFKACPVHVHVHVHDYFTG